MLFNFLTWYYHQYFYFKGMLSIEEARGFYGLNMKNQVNITETAMNRIFEEYILYKEFEMDYKTFVNFALAIDNPITEQSLRYFWKVIDYDKSGRLTYSKLAYFYRDIKETLNSIEYEAS